MTQRYLSLLFLFAFCFVPAPVGTQQPPPPPPAPAAPLAAGFDADAVTGEVRAFYADYWKAWDNRDTQAVANGLAGEFVQYLPGTPKGVLQADKPAAVANVERFFASVHGQQTLWGRSLLAVVPRSPTEAIAAVRNDFTLVDDGGETEITLEVLRKGADGRWRIVRKWSEKRTY